MDTYKELYTTLFNKITDVIAEMQQVQMDTENMYISHAIDEMEMEDASKKNSQ